MSALIEIVHLKNSNVNELYEEIKRDISWHCRSRLDDMLWDILWNRLNPAIQGSVEGKLADDVDLRRPWLQG
jgi:hypothetical protein